MNQTERNQRKAKWIAHGFGIGKKFRETGESVSAIMQSVRDDDANEFDAFTEIVSEVETLLHECGLSAFTEKFLIFMLADQSLRKGL